MSPYRRRRRKKSRKPTTSLIWLVVITLVAGTFAFILGWKGGVLDFIEHFFQYRDDSYRPMDLERALREGIAEQEKTP